MALRKLAVAFAAVLLGCSLDSVEQQLPLTDYAVQVDALTPNGMRVTSNGQDIDLTDIDRLVSGLEECLDMDIDRAVYQVIIAPDWYESPCTKTQLFPCNFSEEYLSEMKRNFPEQAKSSCKFACAGATQGWDTAVVTPNLAALRHELIHLLTGIGNEGHSKSIFARCR